MSTRNFSILNVSMPTAGNEYSLVIPHGALDIIIKCRDTSNPLKVYTVSVGNQGNPGSYYTVDPGQVLVLETKSDGQTFYLQSTGTNVVAEMLYHIDQ
jgi:hypothetical protein